MAESGVSLKAGASRVWVSSMISGCFSHEPWKPWVLRAACYLPLLTWTGLFRGWQGRVKGLVSASDFPDSATQHTRFQAGILAFPTKICVRLSKLLNFSEPPTFQVKTRLKTSFSQTRNAGKSPRFCAWYRNGAQQVLVSLLLLSSCERSRTQPLSQELRHREPQESRGGWSGRQTP